MAQPLNNVSSPVISDKEKSNEASSVMRSSQDLLKLLEQKKEDDRTLHTVEQPLSKAKTEEIAKDTLNEANGSTCNRYFVPSVSKRYTSFQVSCSASANYWWIVILKGTLKYSGAKHLQKNINIGKKKLY